jgi:hypothetical protein
MRVVARSLSSCDWFLDLYFERQGAKLAVDARMNPHFLLGGLESSPAPSESIFK